MAADDTPGDTMPIARASRVLRALAEHLKGRRLLLAAAIITLTVGGALRLALPWGLGRMVDVASGAIGGGAGAVWGTAAILVAAATGFAICTGLGLALVGQALETVLARVREQMVAAGLRMPMSRVERAGTGDLVSRATDDVDQVSIAIGRALPEALSAFFMLAMTVVGLTVLDWRFLLVVLVTVPVYVVGLRMFLAQAPKIYAAERKATARRAHQILGALRGIETVHAFGMSEQLSGRIASHSWSVVVWLMRAVTLANRLWGRFNFAECLGMASILILGFHLVGEGSMTVGQTTTAMLLYLQLFGPIRGVLFVVDDLQAAGAALGRIVGVIDEGDRLRKPQSETDRGRHVAGIVSADHEAVRQPAVNAGLAVNCVLAEQVEFGYDGGIAVLHDVGFTLRRGEHLAIVGSSGAGKTTLAALIAGVHQPTAGHLEVSAQRIGMVSQEVHVFSGTLAQDLRIAAPEADDRALEHALQLARASDWVAGLPDGLNTEVGGQGLELTPMQAQQIALARLALMDPDLVILDEATAEAGSAGAQVLEEGAEAILAGRTAIVVAHRLSQAAKADRIVVLDRGQVIEVGSHDELVRAAGRYAELWAAWSRYRPHPPRTGQPGPR